MQTMTVDEAAVYLSVSRSTVSRACASGQLAGAERDPDGRQWRIPIPALHLVATAKHREQSMTVSELPKLYTLNEVAAQTGMSPRWLADNIRAGNLEACKPGKEHRMTHEQVLAAVAFSKLRNPKTDEIQAERERRANRRGRRAA
jgi:excisionase family DNA binding protein